MKKFFIVLTLVLASCSLDDEINKAKQLINNSQNKKPGRPTDPDPPKNDGPNGTSDTDTDIDLAQYHTLSCGADFLHIHKENLSWMTSNKYFKDANHIRSSYPLFNVIYDDKVPSTATFLQTLYERRSREKRRIKSTEAKASIQNLRIGGDDPTKDVILRAYCQNQRFFRFSLSVPEGSERFGAVEWLWDDNGQSPLRIAGKHATGDVRGKIVPLFADIVRDAHGVTQSSLFDASVHSRYGYTLAFNAKGDFSAFDLSETPLRFVAAAPDTEMSVYVSRGEYTPPYEYAAGRKRLPSPKIYAPILRLDPGRSPKNVEAILKQYPQIKTIMLNEDMIDDRFEAKEPLDLPNIQYIVTVSPTTKHFRSCRALTSHRICDFSGVDAIEELKTSSLKDNKNIIAYYLKRDPWLSSSYDENFEKILLPNAKRIDVNGTEFHLPWLKLFSQTFPETALIANFATYQAVNNVVLLGESREDHVGRFAELQNMAAANYEDSSTFSANVPNNRAEAYYDLLLNATQTMMIVDEAHLRLLEAPDLEKIFAYRAFVEEIFRRETRFLLRASTASQIRTQLSLMGKLIFVFPRDDRFVADFDYGYHYDIRSGKRFYGPTTLDEIAQPFDLPRIYAMSSASLFMPVNHPKFLHIKLFDISYLKKMRNENEAVSLEYNAETKAYHFSSTLKDIDIIYLEIFGKNAAYTVNDADIPEKSDLALLFDDNVERDDAKRQLPGRTLLRLATTPEKKYIFRPMQ